MHKTLFGTAVEKHVARKEWVAELVSSAETNMIRICRAIDALDRYVYQDKASGEIGVAYSVGWPPWVRADPIDPGAHLVAAGAPSVSQQAKDGGRTGHMCKVDTPCGGLVVDHIVEITEQAARCLKTAVSTPGVTRLTDTVVD